MSAPYSKSFDTYDEIITVSHEKGLLPGLIEIEVKSFAGEDEKTNRGVMNLDSTQIDALIVALQEAKALSEVGLEEYNATGC